MKKSIFATAVMFAIVGSASAGDRSVATEAGAFSNKGTQYSQSYGSSNVARGPHDNGKQAQRSKTRGEVIQELKEHQEQMEKDPRYAEEWRSMYSGS